MGRLLRKNINFRIIELVLDNQKRQHKSLSALILFIAFLNGSCNNKPVEKLINEGEIEYHIEYLDNEKDNPFIILLPNEMTTSFGNNSSNTLIKGFLGNFKLTYITNNQKQKNFTLFQMMDKKYYCQEETNRLAFGYENMEGMRIKFTDKYKQIAGYECKKAIASFSDKKIKDIEIYYTEQIELKDPNQNNPFHKIKGVLMEFTVNLMGINMRIKTKKVSGKRIEPQLFEVPKEYSKVTLEEMQKMMNNYNVK